MSRKIKNKCDGYIIIYEIDLIKLVSRVEKSNLYKLY